MLAFPPLFTSPLSLSLSCQYSIIETNNMTFHEYLPAPTNAIIEYIAFAVISVAKYILQASHHLPWFYRTHSFTTIWYGSQAENWWQKFMCPGKGTQCIHEAVTDATARLTQAQFEDELAVLMLLAAVGLGLRLGLWLKNKYGSVSHMFRQILGHAKPCCPGCSGRRGRRPNREGMEV
ncbi:hypothetical protein BAUCODRAFT_286516 [Baudoinia panamericana UAMH 10762]|uniref:Uncharacterized protein n=1 Tax=Baudoinia panamericana (strain UAMH 10762) TaxID=717646 RepID=M2M7Q6_BAUPA|nr:uncharacterized protein BAUCODRAFT_286516 [Baudoinia panamericana UAMH 10762]EMC92361.1 hypothetical protein BAUCODRAFT_286516 [Baudoinia panamericana UAMH 10762]